MAKKINAGEMRHQVSFYLDNGSGQPGPPVFSPESANPKYWCSLHSLKGQLKYTAQLAWQLTTGEITMRYTKVPVGDATNTVYEDIDAGWFALLDGKEWYRIRLVINEDKRNEVYTLTVSYHGPYQQEPPPPPPG